METAEQKQARIDDACFRLSTCLHDLVPQGASHELNEKTLNKLVELVCAVAYAERSLRIDTENALAEAGK